MERKNRIWLVLVNIMAFILFVQFAGAAEITDSLLSQGNNLYLQRQYDKAETNYKRIVALGFESADLYYNLGNALYKQEKFAESILYYEKALLLNPGDEDIKQNLYLANAQIIDKIDVIPDFFVKRWIHSMKGIFSPDQWGIFSIILFALSLLGFVIYMISHSLLIRKLSFSSGFVLLSVSIISIILMFTRISDIQEHDSAIIMAPSVNARSSPDEQSTNVFVLHEGAKVMILDSIQNWREIRIANGNKGWVQKDMLKQI
jgi:tetratricopeptide (TPR) repeat protein